MRIVSGPLGDSPFKHGVRNFIFVGFVQRGLFINQRSLKARKATSGDPSLQFVSREPHTPNVVELALRRDSTDTTLHIGTDIGTGTTLHKGTHHLELES